MGLSGLEISLFKHGVVALVGMPHSTPEGHGIYVGPPCETTGARACRCMYDVYTV